MQRQCIMVLLIASVLGACGCRSASERMMRKRPTNSMAYFRSDYRYRLDDERLEQMTFEGAVEVEDVNVTYQAGLEPQAECLAEQIDGLVGDVESSLGVDICLCTKVYLLRVDVTPTSSEMSFKSEPNCFVMPLFVRAGDESCKAIAAANSIYPSVFMHELAEMSLVFHDGPGVVLPDAAGQILMFRPKLLNYTRWFREGFANYAGYLAYLELRPQIEDGYPSADWGVYTDPFSSLAKVGDGLFKWHNYSPNRLNGDYYSAALGLFLLICDEFGQDSVSRIIQQMQKEDYLDGNDLIRIVDDVLATDIERLVREFKFPKIGWKTTMLTRAVVLNEGLDVGRGLFITEVDPNGQAHEAGLTRGDTIVKVNDQPIQNELDLELAIYYALDAGVANVTVWHKDGGEETVAVRLDGI